MCWSLFVFNQELFPNFPLILAFQAVICEFVDGNHGNPTPQLPKFSKAGEEDVLNEVEFGTICRFVRKLKTDGRLLHYLSLRLMPRSIHTRTTWKLITCRNPKSGCFSLTTYIQSPGHRIIVTLICICNTMYDRCIVDEAGGNGDEYKKDEMELGKRNSRVYSLPQEVLF